MIPSIWQFKMKKINMKNIIFAREYYGMVKDLKIKYDPKHIQKQRI